MTLLVLDASVALSWLLRDGSDQDRADASRTLHALTAPRAQAVVPVTWGLALGNVIARAEARQLLSEAQREAFLTLLASLPIRVDEASAARTLSDTLQLARRYGLSTYDASYLECSLRLGCPLATLDIALAKAARKSGLGRF